MEKKTIDIKYVQIMDRSQGLTIIGRPVELEFAKRIRKELFGDNPDIILYPASSPERMNKNLKMVMGM